MFRPAVIGTVYRAGGKAGTTMLHDLAMRYLAQHRSEQLIGEAQQHNLAAPLRPARSARTGRRVAAMLGRAVTGDKGARAAWRRATIPAGRPIDPPVSS